MQKIDGLIETQAPCEPSVIWFKLKPFQTCAMICKHPHLRLNTFMMWFLKLKMQKN